ncbi:choline ABC transporter ATP-binding protein [Rhodobacteraceae bacterium RKSG542]|uniref:choline ABC transporter ATP-binding protein n=1 Tax=Pseudovibrio flavus TaxID=2529854 RepID=UPI0012BBDC65|nr:choline ABC transporter ATP-binding protein [Pseudovibrio flavus]MTI15807.1 choline ABC transporter ATP-binding protein [Pseudovibrio flavus]
MSKPVVSFKNLSIVFGNKPKHALPLIDKGLSRSEIQKEVGQLVGVANATFDIYEGELLVLMGLSGSGKSTLLRAVNGLNKICRGEVLVRDGADFVNPSTCSKSQLRKLRRNQIAMVFQQFGLLPWRSVRDNVAFGLEIAGHKKDSYKERIDEQLELVGLGGWGDKFVHELSGGMQQRVGLARAFATDAPILLMDEPFSALDPLIRNKLQDDLLELQEKLNRTIIFVSHDLDEAAKLGNRIAIMEGGHVVQIGSPQEIVQKPADEYVKSFVSHMNPLNVLLAQDIMVPTEELTQTEREALSSLPSCEPKRAIRDVISISRETQSAVAVTSGSKPVGVIRDAEIMDCLV